MSRRPPPALAGSLLTLLVAAAPPAASEPTPFDHRRHAEAWSQERDFADTCIDCHPGDGTSDTTRPGRTDHLACEGCHAPAFYGAAAAGPDTDDAPRERVCTVCHVSTRHDAANPVRPFPFHTEEETPRSRCASRDADEYYVEFSHRGHVVEGEATCADCHRVEVEDARPRPGHAQCVACHDGQADDGDDASFGMEACTGCHRLRRDAEGRRIAEGPPPCERPGRTIERFSHFSHRLDRRRGRSEAPVDCDTCHAHVARAESVADIVPIENGFELMVRACGSCHRAGQRSATDAPLVRVTGDCSYCHRPGSLYDESGRAPRSHRRAR